MGKPSLRDPGWYAMKAAVDLRQQQTGDLGAAVLDLEQAMESGKLGSMRRNRAGSECELVSASFWKTHVIDTSLAFVVTIYRRTAIDDTPQRWGLFAHQAADRLDGWLFFVWKPDLDKLYPGGPRVDHDDDSDSPPKVPPGRKPRGNWPKLIAQWLIEVAADDKQRLQNVDALVVDAKIFLRDQIKWAPKDDKDLRAEIRELLERVRR